MMITKMFFTFTKPTLKFLNMLIRVVYIALEEMKKTQVGRAVLVIGTSVVRNDCYKKKAGIHHSRNGWKISAAE